MDAEEFDHRALSADALHILEQRLLSLLRMLAEAGMIGGVYIGIDAAGNFMVSESRPRFTLRGLEYLNENSLMQRAMKMAKGIKNSIPGI